ncbi:hypothetical protein KAX03_03095 [Candidatus Bathyarchaeota archaeon]|nr:hypothetical protein [Candidatus Bathyarchaeota archaeon]
MSFTSFKDVLTALLMISAPFICYALHRLFNLSESQAWTLGWGIFIVGLLLFLFSNLEEIKRTLKRK